MEKGVFIAELHDIGKLIDKDQIEDQIKDQIKGHTFDNFDFDRNEISPSWWGQYHHYDDYGESRDINDWKEIPPKYRSDLFFLIIADHLAASISRAVPPLKGGRPEVIRKLWNAEFYNKKKSEGKTWAAFRSVADLEKMFEDIEKTASADDFLSKYKENLLLTPEDKSIPRNITSLYTHCQLVGKIYRVLKEHCTISNNNGRISLTLDGGEPVTTVKAAEGGNRTRGTKDVAPGKWQARFVKCELKFRNSLVRLQDINLLVKRKELVDNFVKKYGDYVMFYNDEFLALFLPLSKDLKKMFSDFTNGGFFIECEEISADLGILRSNLGKIIRDRRESQEELTPLNGRNIKFLKRVLMPDMSEEISPPICDICQAREAKERQKEDIREWICDQCYQIRESGQIFNYPENWQDSKVVWFKFDLNHRKLESWLQKAFGEYVNSKAAGNGDQFKEAFRSLGCHSDFVKDYAEMLTMFWRCLRRELGRELLKPICKYDELGVCRYSGELIRKIILVFLKTHTSYFPDCARDSESPISLSLSVAPIKYPIREHWRYFQHPSGFLNIRSHDIFEDSYTKDEVEWLLNKLSGAKTPASHFLYKLAGLYDELRSNINIMVEILNHRNSYPDIYGFYCQFKTTPRKMLNFFRIVEESDDETKTDKAGT